MCSFQLADIELFPFHIAHVTCKMLQDLPEFFEDNMATWMTHFQTLLSTNNPLLVTEVMIICYCEEDSLYLWPSV